MANLTKDEYLEMRAAGMGKSAIAKKIGASPSFVTDRLARWELKGDYQERMAIKAWRESHADPEEVVEREPDVEVVDTHVEESVPTPVSLPACPCVTLSIPITDNLPPMPSDVPTRIWRGTREDVMRFGLGWVQLAVNDAAEELRDILGVEDVTQQVQAYIERMLKG